MAGTLQILIKWTITAVKTGAYTTDYGEVVRCDPTGGGFTVTLPSAAAAGAAGRQIIVKNASSSTNTITVDGDGSETIDGSSTKTIATAYGTMNLVSDGANWLSI
jgi:hypothetical protein